MSRQAVWAAGPGCRRRGQCELPVHPVESAKPGLDQATGGADPAESLLDALGQALAGAVAAMSGGAPGWSRWINPGVPGLHMRLSTGMCRVTLRLRTASTNPAIPLACSGPSVTLRSFPRRSSMASEQSCLPLGGVAGPSLRSIDDQRVTVHHQGMAHAAEWDGLFIALSEPQRVSVQMAMSIETARLIQLSLVS